MHKKSFFTRISEISLILYLILGGLDKLSILKNIDYILSLLLQILVLIYLLLRKDVKLRVRVLTIYLINLSLISIILLNFVSLNVDPIDIVNRIIPLLSLFGIIIVFSIDSNRDGKKYIDLKNVLAKTIYGYLFIGIIILGDALSYIFFKKSFWPPESYLGLRFSGPFYDSNFLGLFYGALLIIILYYKDLTLKYKKTILLVFSINIILSLSWSSIAILILAIVFSQIIKLKNIFIKQLLILVSYMFFIKIFIINKEFLEITFINFFSTFLPFTENELIAKFLSLDYRIIVQNEALQISKENLMGMGPRTLVPILGMDTHNSYIGFLFELGIPGLLLLLINIKYNFTYHNKMLEVLSTFIFLMALTLNVHYSVVYILLVILVIDIFYKNKSKIEFG